jgi:hypothetical protein
LLSAALPDREPPDSIWLGIEERLAVVPVTGEKTSPIWGLFGWLRVPQLGYAMAAVLFCLLVGLFMVQKPVDDSRYLAELEAFTIEVKGNPFQEKMGTENPFFQLSHSGSDNPFEGLGGSKQ